MDAGVEVRLRGHAGVLEADALEVALLSLAARRPACVIFDMSKLESISSLAMGILATYRRAAVRTGGRVCLAAEIQVDVRELLDSARLLSLFEAVDGMKPDAAQSAPEDNKSQSDVDDTKCTVGITWARLVELEPELETLLWQARGAAANCRSSSDVNQIFGPVRNQLAALVGYAGRHRTHAILGGAEAYHVAYSKLYDAVAGLLSGRSSGN
jgi:anti-anti-sigma factor